MGCDAAEQEETVVIPTPPATNVGGLRHSTRQTFASLSARERNRLTVQVLENATRALARKRSGPVFAMSVGVGTTNKCSK